MLTADALVIVYITAWLLILYGKAKGYEPLMPFFSAALPVMSIIGIFVLAGWAAGR